MLGNTKESFGFVNKALHWSMALFLASLFFVGIYMTELDYYDPLYHSLPWWHKSIGLLTMLLLLIRIIWVLRSPTPETLKTHKKWEVSLAHLIQKAFYLLILFIGISGYFIATAKGKGIEFFNWFEFPSMTNALNEETAGLIGNAHYIMALILAGLVFLHISGALKHHFIDKDETLKRMINK